MPNNLHVSTGTRQVVFLNFSSPLLVLLLFCITGIHAQTYEDLGLKNDTLGQSDDSLFAKEKFLPTYTIGEGSEHHSIDTSFGNYFYDPTLENYEYRNTGNLGNAHVPIDFPPEKRPGFDLGYHQFDLYRLSLENIRFYYDHRLPFSHLFFLVGLRKEQLFNVTHSQNIGRLFNFGFHYRRIASEGDYINQLTKHNDIGLTSRYGSKNEKYGFKTILIFNNINTNENGGVRNVNLFPDANFGRNKKLVETELDDAKNKQINANFTFNQHWNLGETVIEQINDTTTRRHFFPTLTFYQETGVSRDIYRYRDENPDSAYYGFFYTMDDSAGNPLIRHYLKSRELTARLGVRKTFIKTLDSTHVVYRNIVLEAWSRYSHFTITEDPSISESPDYLDVKASLRSYPDSNRNFMYDFTTAYSFLDYNRGDFSIESTIGYHFKKTGLIQAFGSYRHIQPAWVFQNFTTTGFSWENNFDQTKTLAIGALYKIPKFNFHISGTFRSIRNLTYWNEQRLPVQYAGNIAMFNVEVRKLFRLNDFGWDNLIRLNVSSDSYRLRYPLYWSIHSFFYEKGIFKGHLLTRVGFNLSYNTDYFAYGYFGLTGQFHLQEDQKLNYYPVTDLFLYFKIKTLWLFLTYRHLNQGMFRQKTYFTAYKYPAQDRTFNVGISWRFYD